MRYLFLFLFLISSGFTTTSSTTITDSDTVKIGVLAKRGSAVNVKKCNPRVNYLKKHIPPKALKIGRIDQTEILW